MAHELQSAAFAWRGYKKLWILRLLSLALLFLFMVVAVNLGDESVEHGLGRLFLVLGSLAWIAAIWADIRLSRWPCPRCGKPFIGFELARFLTRNRDIRRYCKNCGLEKWEDPNTT